MLKKIIKRIDDWWNCRSTIQMSNYIYAEGKYVIGSQSSHVEGYADKATENHAHAEGYAIEATGTGSHSE